MERKAKVLIYDIETSPIIGYTWSTWQTDVIEIIEDWQILTVAWKWLGENKVHVIGQDDFKGYTAGVNDDLEVVQHIHSLFEAADVVVAHNGNQFDQRKVAARMIIHGMNPPAPYKQIDTKQIAKRYAAFTSNSLKNLAKDFKTHNQKGDPGGFATWRGCLDGDKKAWKTMKKYNKQDITTLEDIYLRLRPWCTNHPNMARLQDAELACPKCGENKLQMRGYRVTNTGKFQRAQCQSCGGWCSLRTGENKNVDVKPTFVNYS